jgi:hypothetical protein
MKLSKTAMAPIAVAVEAVGPEPKYAQRLKAALWQSLLYVDYVRSWEVDG